MSLRDSCSWSQMEGTWKEKSILLLRQACLRSLWWAMQLELSSIALTAISSGLFGMLKDICAQVMFKAVVEFSASDGVQFCTLRDVRMVIIDDPTNSVFQEEFVKRYLSKEASPGTVTNHQRLSHEEIETSPATILKPDPQKFNRANSVDSMRRTETEDNKPSDGKSERGGEFESPSVETAQDEEKHGQRDVSDNIKERPLSNQGTENTNKANIPSSVKVQKQNKKESIANQRTIILPRLKLHIRITNAFLLSIHLVEGEIILLLHFQEKTGKRQMEASICKARMSML